MREIAGEWIGRDAKLIPKTIPNLIPKLVPFVCGHSKWRWVNIGNSRLVGAIRAWSMLFALSRLFILTFVDARTDHTV